MPYVNRAEIDATGTARTVVDRAILARTTGLSEETIRKRFTPLKYDGKTGRALYDVEDITARMRQDNIQPRPENRGPRRSARRRR